MQQPQPLDSSSVPVTAAAAAPASSSQVPSNKRKMVGGMQWPHHQPSSASATTTVMTSMSALDAFLDRDKRENANESWNRLNRTMRLRKLTEYATTYCAENALAEDERAQLVAFFRDCLDRKKLHRIKEVLYDVETGRILNVPVLAYNRATRHYTLKNTATTTAAASSTTARVRGAAKGRKKAAAEAAATTTAITAEAACAGMAIATATPVREAAAEPKRIEKNGANCGSA